MQSKQVWRGLFVLLALCAGATGAWAHGVSGGDAEYLKNITGVQFFPLLYLGPRTWSRGTTTCCSLPA